VDYIGTVRRFTKSTEKEIVNRSFFEFLKENKKLHLLGPEKVRGGETMPGQYRMVFSNLQASFKSASKYDKAQPTSIDEKAFALAGEWTKKHWQPYCGGAGILDQESAIKEMDLGTSCGYPHSLKFAKKSDMLKDGASSKILEDYWEAIGLREQPPIPIWTCSQKIELRSIEKLEANKVRTFTASPIEHTVALNRLCLDYNNRFYASAGKTWSFVGATKYLQGWDGLYRRLNRLPHAFELDESDYDSSLFARLMYGQRDLRWSMYSDVEKTPENKKRLWALYDLIVHSVIVLENGELCQKHTGNPSGSGNTIVDNTQALFRLFAYAWIVLCKAEEREVSYLEFMEEVEAALNGDDNTFTVSDKVVGWFNPTSIAPVWTSIGVTTKTPCEKPRDLSEVSFLSQSFHKDVHTGVWMPVPETAKVLCSLMYGSNVDDVRWHYLRACALRIDSYGNEVVRGVLSSYIQYLNCKHGSAMIGKCNDVDIQAIRNVWMSDSAVEALYCGLEGKPAAIPQSALEIWESLLDTEVDGVPMKNQAPFKTSSDQSEPFTYLLPGETHQSLSVLRAMTKTKAQKAARKLRKKQAKMGGPMKKQSMQPKKGKRGPIFRNPVPVGPRPKFGGTGRLGLGGGRAGATSRRAQVIEEDEYIGEINGSVGFATTAYAANPGQQGTFPWGFKIAQLYEEYDYEMLEFYYKREVSEFATNGQAGKVMLSFDFDASDIAPTTKQQVEDTVPHQDGMPCTETIRLPIDCVRIRKNDSKYVRPGAQPANTDLKTYDAGNLFVSTYGCTNTSVIGELRVRYRVRLSEPVLEAGLVGNGAVHFSSTSATTSNNFGGAVLQAGGTPALQAITLGTGTVVFPASLPGNYLLTLSLNANTSASALTNFTGGTALNLFGAGGSRDAASSVQSAASTGASYTMLSQAVTIPVGGATLTLASQSVLIGGATSMDLFIVALPSTVLTVDEQEQEEIDALVARATSAEERLAAMEERLSAFLGSSSPETNARFASKRSREEEKGETDEVSPNVSGDELGASVHIPRGILSKFMRK
jgi:hypothetical protein